MIRCRSAVLQKNESPFVARLRGRFAKARLQLAVAGQQQQAFTVGIQATRNIHIGNVNEVLQPAPAPFGGELAEDAVGIVEADQVKES